MNNIIYHILSVRMYNIYFFNVRMHDVKIRNLVNAYKGYILFALFVPRRRFSAE